MTIAVIGRDAPDVLKYELEALGLLVLELRPHRCLPKPEQCHADLQFSKISWNKVVFAPGTDSLVLAKLSQLGVELQEGYAALQEKYPHNVAYNTLFAGRIFFHNTNYTDKRTLEAFRQEKISSVFVRQGYAGCSGLSVSVPGGEALLTADRGLWKGARLIGMPCFFYPQGNDIVLPGYDHGFLGGCGGWDPERGLLMTGYLDWPDLPIPVISLTNAPLLDVGGILTLQTL